jgi:hypothetical protein
MSEFDRITLEYINSIESIEVDYADQITNIELTIGQNVQTVYSVNNLYGDVVLTASTTLSLWTSSSGYYDHLFNHNLNYQYVNVSLYDEESREVYADIFYESASHVNIRAAIDLTGYKAVAQR